MEFVVSLSSSKLSITALASIVYPVENHFQKTIEAMEKFRIDGQSGISTAQETGDFFMTNGIRAISERKLYRPREAAAILGLGPSMVYKMATDGRISSVRIGRALRIPAAEVESLAKAGTTAQSEPFPAE